MNICQVVTTVDNQASGVDVCVRHLSAALANLSHDVVVQTLGGDGEQGDGYVIERHPISCNKMPGLRSMACSRSLRAALNRGVHSGVDLIHAHGIWQMSNIYAVRAATSREGVPLVLSTHGMLSAAALKYSRVGKRLFWALYQSRALQSASCLHATSEQEYQEIRQAGVTAPVAIVPNGVEVYTKRENSRKANKKRVVSVGRIHPKKGLDRLVDAWRMVHSRFPGWELVIAGPDENGFKDALEAQARRVGAERVVFRGPVFGDEKVNLVATAELFVLPTRSDNFALTVAESLAMGTPVISTTAAPWEGLETHGCGWWVEQDVGSIASAMVKAMSLSTAERKEMGERGRAWMDSSYSWRSIADKYDKLYRWLKGLGKMPDFVVID